LKQIKGLGDLQMVKNERTFSNTFLKYLEQEWLELYETYSDGKEKEKFTLDQDQRLVILEPGDSIPKGFRKTYFPEYVEKVLLDDVELYRMYVMEAEDYGVMYYSIVRTLDVESEVILQEYAEMNDR
jgi:hypothetical protein